MTQQVQRQNKLPDPYLMFCDATGHWKSAALLGRAKNQRHYALSMLVLESFSLEIHLKCLLRLRGIAFGRNHDTPDFFRSLSVSDQSRIAAMFDNAVGADVQINDVLSRSAELFVKGRYRFDPQHEKWNEVASQIALNNGLSQLIAAVHRVILDTQPTWEGDYNAQMGPTE